MIHEYRLLSIIRDRDFPVNRLAAHETVLEHSVLEQPAMLHVTNPSSLVLTIGKRGALKFYNLDELRKAGVFVHQRDFGGSGAMYGHGDALFSLQINKASFIDGYEVSAAEAHHYFNGLICDVINKLGVDAYIDKEDKAGHKEDGVCAHLQGRSEIRAANGNKMAVSVYREDEVGFYMRGVILVTTAWAMIYNFLASPCEPMQPVDCLQMQLGKTEMKDEVIKAIIERFGEAFGQSRPAQLTFRQEQAVVGIKDKYKVT